MTRRTRIEFGVLAILAATVVLLFLNYNKKHHFPPSLERPPEALNAPRPPWLDSWTIHPCPLCIACSHRLELDECRLLVTVTIREPWYRLFGAGTKTHRYEDPGYLGGALENSDATAAGTWTIRGRYLPVDDESEPHPCPAVARDFELRYKLHVGPFPGMESKADPTGTLAVPTKFMWTPYRFKGEPKRVVDFWWELESSTFSARAKCACGK